MLTGVCHTRVRIHPRSITILREDSDKAKRKLGEVVCKDLMCLKFPPFLVCLMCSPLLRSDRTSCEKLVIGDVTTEVSENDPEVSGYMPLRNIYSTFITIKENVRWSY